MTERYELPKTDRTDIYKTTQYGDDHIGYLDDEGYIYRIKWGKGLRVGRVQFHSSGQKSGHRIFRYTQHDERELGTVDAHGGVYSYGLFEGGELGWLDENGIVVRGGLIIEEEDVGRVDGPRSREAAAALLLLFLPDDDEASKEMTRR